ncbi:MAG: Na(+)-translocating NADH-quinone reductase subunit A [Oceanospirillales bacterium TMED33]|nr:NADH:ubiquinone reductase (Na(+)-transporting) subunit A [Gammaproteobacteria bacterium]RPG22282.1 MAG: Na(+)-translocating NADH-quinone reductase subunit A [Oceanospirillales bacterium TMED33]
MIEIKTGLDLPIKGSPKQEIGKSNAVKRVAVIGSDYPGMKPTMLVKEGDQVKLGQPLFADKKNEGVYFTSPGSGKVIEINRGERRLFQSVVIELDGKDTALKFKAHNDLGALTRKAVVEELVESGLWTSIRRRPYEKIPAIDAVPHSIFVNAMDTNPLAGDQALAITRQPKAFVDGISVMSKLTEGTVFVCRDPEASFDAGSAQVAMFSGKHPAGLVGTHIHHLDPVGEGKEVWHVSAQDVIAIGRLCREGILTTERVVSLAGPSVKSPRLVLTRVGASVEELTSGELIDGSHRIVSGSILGGRTASGVYGYLGRYHQQISVLEEGTHRVPFGWLSPGTNKHSVMGIYLSKLVPTKLLEFTTNTNGSPRAMVPIGTYEKIMPLDILPTQLLRSLIVGDTDMAVKLGALELAEEDLALCTYVCPGKYEYGPILRDNLTTIELES